MLVAKEGKVGTETLEDMWREPRFLPPLLQVEHQLAMVYCFEEGRFVQQFIHKRGYMYIW